MKFKIIIYPFICIIKIYQIIISPLFGNQCRFVPSCSEYAIQSFKNHGLLKGFYFSLKRILKCHPFGGQGFDPIPKKKLNK